jgi:hypothetical protein
MKKVLPFPHRWLSLCRPSGPGRGFEETWWQQHHRRFTQNTSPEGAALPRAGADTPRGGRSEKGSSFPPPVAVATGSRCAGPPGLEEASRKLDCSEIVPLKV